MTSHDKTLAAFRNLHQPGDPFVIPNPWDVGSARMLAGLGFKALATTSSGFALTLGRKDYNVTRGEAVRHGGEIADAVDIPVIADLENGFGPAPEDAAQTIRDALATGLSGGSIEDSTGDKDNPIYEKAHAIDRIAAAVETVKSADRDFILTARAEAFLHGRGDLDEVIARLNAFAEAGADVVYAPGLPDLNAVSALCSAVSKPVNVLIIGKLAKYSVADFAKAGAARLSIGGGLAWSAYGTLGSAAEMLKDGHFNSLGANKDGAKTDVMTTDNAQPDLSGRSAWRREFIALMTIGLPMGLTQLIQFSINTVDVLMIGRLGSEPLAAASLGLVMFYVLFVAGMGPAMAVSPMVSQALGADANDTRDARRSVRMGLWVVGIGAPLLGLVYFFTEEIALALGQPPELAKLAEPYVLALAPGLPFALGVIILRNFLAAIERTRWPLVFIILTTALNAFLNYVLIYGNFGAPRLELVGAGIASSLSHAVGFFALVAYIEIEKRGKTFTLFRKFFTPDWERFREVLKLGWPISITIGFEAMLFNACVFLMGRIGVDEVAAYQVALNVAAVAFMTPLGLSMAGAVRVGLKEGAKDRPGVRRAAALTILASIGAILIVAIPVMAAPHGIAGLYLDASDPTNAVVLGLVASFLPIAAAFALFDATQVAAAQALRGLKDVRIPMIITGVSYWVIGFPVSAGLGLFTPLGAVGVWYGLLVGLAAAAIMLGARLWWITRD
ncbi:Probable multidrug resistance protein NorM (Multidrug-efflux transporter) [Durusdinium trenchii]|uniref:Probable multidrug resistance protein NorM (Multidrug-efflux transporter) n=1 Tax=Durusdinium trenchii TaxID=1381693 RepID=A0ABP0LJN6_9DINO